MHGCTYQPRLSWGSGALIETDKPAPRTISLASVMLSSSVHRHHTTIAIDSLCMNLLRYLQTLNNRKTNLFKLHSRLKRQKMSTRAASHAGSWYEEDPRTLSKQLDGWLSKVPNDVKGDELPIPGARVIIAP